MSKAYWLRQAYLACLPAYPIGYLIVHGFRGDEVWTRVYVERSGLEVSDHLRDIVESELDKVEDVKHGKIRISLTDNMDPNVYGGFFLSKGAEIQFPVRCSFTDVEQGRRQGAHVEVDLGLPKYRRKLEVNSGVADELISRMVLSDAALRFLAQRQLQLANNGVLFCAPIFGWLGIWSAGYALMVGSSLAIGPLAGFGVSVLLSSLGFVQFLRSLARYTVEKADLAVVEKDPMYLEGAREFMTSSLKLNRFFRKILGAEGETCFAQSGDSKLDPIPYSQRLRTMENYLRSKKANL